MKRLRGLVRLLILLPLLIPAQSLALAAPSGVVITEIQTTGSDNATSEEFVEIYNPTNQTIDISTWKLQYLSAAGSTWQTKATLNGWLYPQGRILLASTDYLTEVADISFNSGFKLEAGHVRLVSPDPDNNSQFVVEDLIGWGTALYPETLAAVYAPAGNSLQRKQVEGAYQDTNNNFDDFEVVGIPSPESDNQAPEGQEEITDDTPIEEEVVVEESPPEELSEEVDNLAQDSDLGSIQITELLPNPASPASDSTDEYVELYNPNSEAIDLSGYKLQTGSAFSYSYTLDDVEIEPNGYIVLYVEETGLILSNTTGQARLISPNGTVIFQTQAYEDADDGEVWALIDGVWQWSTVLSPGANNIPSPVLASTTTTDSAKKTKTKKAPKPKKSKAKKSTKSTKKKKTSGVAGANDEDETGSPTESSTPIHSMVIAGTGVLAVGYALYEYKDDFLRRFRKFGRNHRIGQNIGPAA